LEEGVIKFNIKELKKEKLDIDISDIEKIREELFKLKLIGFNKEQNLGYGNISKRINEKEFIISGSQTGNLKNLKIMHYSLITGVDFKTNSVFCKGLIEPSSESLTHAAFYTDKKYNAVIHIHNLKLWNHLIEDGYISTPEDAPYGSIKLWRSIFDILENNKYDNSLTIVMKGHKEGIVVASSSLDDAMDEILILCDKYNYKGETIDK